jgi:hypothetical protein
MSNTTSDTAANDVLMVFTGKGLSQILADGGSQSWALNADRARRCRYLVCTQNRPGLPWSKPEAEEGAGFLIGKISGVTTARDEDSRDRFLIEIECYAEIDMPKLWDGGRNPVRYTNLADLGIDVAKLTFKPLPATKKAAAAAPAAAPAGLTVQQAKEGLAKTFGVPLSAIEIVIRA